MNQPEFKFTKEEQADAINKIVKLMNKYKLNIITEHNIRIVPLPVEEVRDADLQKKETR